MLFNILNFVVYLFKQCISHQQLAIIKVPYKLLHVEYCSQTREPILFLQQAKPPYIIKRYLSVFLQQKNILDSLSKKDIESIIELKTMWRLSPTLQLISHFTKNHITYLVFRDKSGNTFVEELKKTGRKKEFLEKLSPNNAHLLGYLLANEDQSQGHDTHLNS